MNGPRFAKLLPRLVAEVWVRSLLSACGGDHAAFDDRTGDADQYAAQCAAPRTGNDPYNDNRPYPDRQGTLADERDWLYAYMDAIYLWYREIPDVDAASYTAAQYGSVPAALDADRKSGVLGRSVSVRG